MSHPFCKNVLGDVASESDPRSTALTGPNAQAPAAGQQPPIAIAPPHKPILSGACLAVLAAPHPSPENGGPCATCAFRPGTEASRTEHTVVLAHLCVEGGRTFHCHEKKRLCRGFVAAINLKHQLGEPFNENLGLLADKIGDAITEAHDFDNK